jgi:hypothetical protein
VFLRTTAGAALAPTAALPAGAGAVRDVALDPDDWRSAYAIDNNQVFRTTDAGASWTDITGNLAELGVGDFNTTEFVAGSPKDLLLVGTNAGGLCVIQYQRLHQLGQVGNRSAQRAGNGSRL